MSYMVRMPLFASVCLVTLVALASACAPQTSRPGASTSTPQGSSASGGSAERSQSTAADSMIEVSAGREFTIVLNSNPTTGYSWRLAQPLDEKVLKLVNQEYLEPTPAGKTPMVGAGGKEVWAFSALSQGNIEINMEYVRPWEKEPTPAEKLTFKVVIR